MSETGWSSITAPAYLLIAHGDHGGQFGGGVEDGRDEGLELVRLVLHEYQPSQRRVESGAVTGVTRQRKEGKVFRRVPSQQAIHGVQ